MKEKRFRVGDTVTYLKRPDDEFGYRFGGVCQGGLKGEIEEYYGGITVNGCYAILVTVPSMPGHSYKMLESEFEEYNNPVGPQSLDNYSIC